MVEANPYAAPTSDLIVESADECGDSKVLSFGSRAGRLRYIARVSLFSLASYLILGVAFVAAIAGQSAEPSGTGIALGYLVAVVGSMVFCIMFAVQRLHDLNHSGWMAALVFIPLVNAALGLYLLFARGTEGNNNYGAPPPPNTLGIKLAALIFPLIFVVGIAAGIAIPAYQDYAVRAQQAQVQVDLD